MELCHEVQCYAEECRGMYLCSTKHDDTQQVVRVLSLERSLDEDIMHTIGFGTLRFGARLDHRADRELLFITLQHCTLTRGTWISSLDAHITRKKTKEDGMRQLVDGTPCIVMSGIRTKSDSYHSWFDIWRSTEAYVTWQS